MNNVYVTLVGGLGNQLFQIATGFEYAKKHNKNLLLDDSKWTISHASPGKRPETYKKTLFKNFRFSSQHNTTPTAIYEKRFNYDELPDEKGDVVLHGYFQSEKYFSEYAEEFKSMLDFGQTADFNIQNFGSMNVAAHIRRSDYLMHRNVHYVCDTEYFNKAFSFFVSDTIDVYSDSMSYVVEEFQFPYRKNLRFVTGCDDVKTLYMLSQYDNLIASNSSFSWWASFLGKKKTKIIVPDIWFKNFEKHDDIYRTEFTRIPV
jgi:hypothetical protein